MDTAAQTSPSLCVSAVTWLLVAPTHTAQCRAAGSASVSAIRSAGRQVWTPLQRSVRKLIKTLFIYLFEKHFGAFDWCDYLYQMNGPPSGGVPRQNEECVLCFHFIFKAMRVISVRKHVPMTTVVAGDTLTKIYCTQLCKSLSPVIKICPQEALLLHQKLYSLPYLASQDFCVIITFRL